MTSFLEKLFKLIGKLPYDKALHVLAGVVVFAVAYPIVGWYALLSVIMIAIAKELYDHSNPNHTVDWKDAMATIIGGLLVAIPLLFQGCG